MTVKFLCPKCDALIAFNSRHAGKRARCLTCGQLFIIPAKDDEKPQIIKPEPEYTEPLPGFYRAVFVDNWRLFIDRDNATPLVFVVAVVCFKFFLAPWACCNLLAHAVIWGWLLGFYLNIIYETAFDIDKLPEIYLGTSITFLWYIIQPFLTFFLTMFLVQLPLIIALALLQGKGVTYENMWQAHTGWNLLLQALFLLGLFLFPIAILTTAVGKEFTMLLRPYYLFVPIFKASLPYIVIVALLVTASLVETHTDQFTSVAKQTLLSAAGKLSLNLLVQLLAIIAMRSIGLFYRHYSCHLPW